MAITNAQQYQQLVKKSSGNERPGYRGDAAYRSRSAQSSPSAGGQGNVSTKSERGDGPTGPRDTTPDRPPSAGGLGGSDAPPSSKVIKEQKENYEKQFYDKGQVPPLGSRPISLGTKIDQRNKQKRLNYINNLINARRQKILGGLKIAGIEGVTEENFDELYNKGMLNIPSVADLVEQGFYSKDGRFATEGAIPDFPGMRPPGILGLTTDILGGPLTTDRIDQLLQETIDLENLKTTEGIEGTSFNELMKTYEPNRFKLMNPETGGRDDDPILPIIPTDDQTTPEDPKQILTTRILGSQFDPTFFAADGGIMNADIVGGLADGNMDEMGRQMYGLGKLVKKATRAVKKIVKSPVGKAALGIAAFKFGPAFFGKGSLNPFLAKSIGGDLVFSPFGSALSKIGLVNKLGFATITGGLTLSSIIPLLAGKQDEEKDEFLKITMQKTN